MWIVRLALRRPYTFVVFAMLVVIMGVLSILRMPTDVFPEINIPVLSVIYNFAGMPADEMESRIVTQFERFAVTIVKDVEHIESQSLTGVGVVKIYFQPGANIEEAMASVVATAQTGLRLMPPGTQPPIILRYSASSVPILQLSIHSETIPEQQLFDITINQLRTQLITIPGVLIPYPYGGRQRQVMVDLDPENLYAWGISAQEVSTAIGDQNLILPAGTAKIGDIEYPVRLNSSPDVVADLNALPVKTVNGTTVFVRDVAHVRDGYQVQTNVVHAGGKRGVLLSILKQGNASTLDVVDAVKKLLPEASKQLPEDLKIDLLIDQSVFVRASVEGVVKEAAIAAGLTGLMILLFLGSLRSTLIVVISIPLSILVSIIVLGFLGESLNVMTLGGMALAVGILVDDATVEIENIHRNVRPGKTLLKAILDGAQQIAVPSFVATLCICIVFIPVAFIGGSAKFLFTPLAMAVVFAMMTSYFLSRTLLPTMVHYLLPAELEGPGGADPPLLRPEAGLNGALHLGRPLSARERFRAWLSRGSSRMMLIGGAIIAAAAYYGLSHTMGAGAISGFFGRVGSAFARAARWAAENPVNAGLTVIVLLAGAALLVLIARLKLILRVHWAFNRQFERFRIVYGGLLRWCLHNRLAATTAFIVLVAGSCILLLPVVGSDFFPSVDAGQLRLHVRCPPGTRIEESERLFADVSAAIRRHIPERELDAMLDNIGVPNSGINLSLSDGTLMSPADGEILISLKPGHAPTDTYARVLRRELAQEFPSLTFFFQAPDIVSQVLNFGLSSPIDVQFAGPIANEAENQRLARQLLADLRAIPGVTDLHMQQVTRTPQIRVDVDRTLASQAGLTQKDVAQNLLISLSGTLQAAPNFWMNPKNGVTYSIIVQTPQYKADTIDALRTMPVLPPGAASGAPPQLLDNVSNISRSLTATNITHYNILRSSDVLMNISGADLGSAGARVREIVNSYRAKLPRGSTLAIRGQVESMRTSFLGLGGGLIFAIVLVYLLMAVNFQSWIDPLVILMALPGAAAGILWMLFITGTTLNVPALMGAIMAVGVATANSILMVTFANDQRKDHGMNARDAALSAGLTRLRPVVMTALAMIIGMLPMSLGLGEGGEQNAPLGRAVIGGLTLATFATLLFVPVCYSVLRRAQPRNRIDPDLATPAELAIADHEMLCHPHPEAAHA